MPKIFVSYSKTDIKFARHLVQLLDEAGIPAWLDDNPEPDENWWQTIEQTIKESNAIILIMSPNSHDSRWVKRELILAQTNKIKIFPILLAGEKWSRFDEAQIEEMTAGVEATLPDRLRLKLMKYVSTDATTLRLEPLGLLIEPSKASAKSAKNAVPDLNTLFGGWLGFIMGILGFIVFVLLIVILTQ